MRETDVPPGRRGSQQSEGKRKEEDWKMRSPWTDEKERNKGTGKMLIREENKKKEL